MTVDVIIPALDEEASLPEVLAAIPRTAVRDVIVVDNGSRDRTTKVAVAGGATVVTEPRRGYGAACLAGIRHVSARPPQVVVFLDAGGSVDPAELSALVEPIAKGRADLVLGTRDPEKGALPYHNRAGSRLATALMAALYGYHYRDLGPFRAIRWQALAALGTSDTGLGFPVEMQVKALRAGLRIEEVKVRCRRRRTGTPKIAGTLSTSLRASGKVLFTILRYSTSR